MHTGCQVHKMITVLTGQHVLSKLCILFLLLLGKWDAVLGQIDLGFFNIVCQIKNLRHHQTSEVYFGNLGIWHWGFYRLSVMRTDCIASCIGHIDFYKLIIH